MVFDPNRLKFVDKEPSQEKSFDPKRLVPVSKDYTSTVDDYRFSTDTIRSDWDKRGKITWAEAAIKSNELELLPFSPFGVARMGGLKLAADRLKKNDYEDESQKMNDTKKLNKFMLDREEESYRGFTYGAQVYRGVSQLPGYMIEFAATGGLASIGKKAAIKGIEKVLQKTVEKGAAGVAVKTAGIAVGATFRAPAMYNHYIPKYGERQILANVALTDKGIKLYEDARETPFTSFLKAYGDTVIEVFSEETGGVLLKPLGGAIGKLAAKKMPKLAKAVVALAKKFPQVSNRFDIMTKAGYHGFIEEMGEERIGDTLRAIYDIDEVGNNDAIFQRLANSIPSVEQLSVELGIFSIPGVTNIAAQKVSNYLETRGSSKEETTTILDSMTQTEKEEFVETNIPEDVITRKVVGLAQGVEDRAVAKGLTEGFGTLPEYETVNMEDQAIKANEIVDTSPEEALQIAMGEKAPPEGVIPEAVFVAVENKAIRDGDVETLRDLAVASRLTTEATTMGQRIRTLGERDPESPVGAIKEIQNIRETRAKKKETTGRVKQDVATIKESIKKESPQLSQWESFIKELEC